MKRRLFLGTAVAASAGTLSACGSGDGDSAGNQSRSEAELPAHVDPPEIPGSIDSDVEGVPPLLVEPIQEYSKSVDSPPGDGSVVRTFQILWGAPPRPKASNRYWQEVESRLNIKYEPTLAAETGYNDKLSTTIASGEVPDLTFVQDQDPIGQRAIQDGAFADLTDVLSGENILEWPNLSHIEESTWRVSSKDGRIWGIPNQNPYLVNIPGIRLDLLEMAGYDGPGENADEFLQVMTDVASMGSAHGKQIWGIGNVDHNFHRMFEWMFRVGTDWQIDDSGNVISRIMTDAFEETLKYEKQFWDAGIIHPDGLSGTLPDLYIGGQAAMTIASHGGFFSSDSRINQAKGAVPEAETGFLVPPAFDGGELAVQRDDGYWGMVCISAESAKNEDKLKQLLGIVNYWRAPKGSEEELFMHSGIEGVHYEFGPEMEIIENGDESDITDRNALSWPGVLATTSFTIPPGLEEYAEPFKLAMEKLVSYTVPNPVAGMSAASNARLSARLQQIDQDFRNGVITGRTDISEIDSYRQNWLESGGQTITEEYQNALEQAG